MEKLICYQVGRFFDPKNSHIMAQGDLLHPYMN